MLHPYKGTRRREHFGPDARGAYRRNTYGTDQSGSKTYYFNALGFRGEEFDPASPVKLFVCGCSYTFGTGLDFEESWSFLFKQKLAELRGLPESSVNLINFAQGGASNDYVTRTLLEQSARVRPDVIVAGFTYMNRFELLDETTAFHFQPLLLERYARIGGKFAELGRLAEFLFLGTDEVQEKVRMIKNVLLLQNFCRARDISLVFFFFESLTRADLPSALSVPTTRPLFEEIDLGALIPVDSATVVDLATDGAHPGPRSQKLMAEAAWETFCSRYG
jgi:hypothetical protein